MVNTEVEGDVATRRVDARRNYDRIVDVATTVLATDPQATLQDIAESVGLHRATLHRHFRSREDLMAALRARSAARTMSALDAAEAPDVPADEQMTLFTRLVLQNAVPTGLWRFASYYGAGMDEHIIDLARRIAALIAGGQRNGDLRADLTTDQLRAIWTGVVYASLPMIDAGAMTMDEGVDLVMAALRPAP